jgi:hypothetical protein
VNDTHTTVICARCGLQVFISRYGSPSSLCEGCTADAIEDAKREQASQAEDTRRLHAEDAEEAAL